MIKTSTKALFLLLTLTISSNSIPTNSTSCEKNWKERPLDCQLKNNDLPADFKDIPSNEFERLDAFFEYFANNKLKGVVYIIIIAITILGIAFLRQIGKIRADKLYNKENKP